MKNKKRENKNEYEINLTFSIPEDVVEQLMDKYEGDLQSIILTALEYGIELLLVDDDDDNFLEGFAFTPDVDA